jgi:hypothetical protein
MDDINQNLDPSLIESGGIEPSGFPLEEPNAEALSEEPHEGGEEAEGEPSQEHEEEDERIALKRKLSKLQREKNRLYAETRKLREEKDQYANYMEHSNKAAMTHYDEAIQLRLDKAKQAKKIAYEMSDPDGIVEADIELARVAAQIESLNSWKAQEAARQQQYSHHYQQESRGREEPEVEFNEESQSWIAQNPWFDANRREYDPEKAEAALAYARSLDLSLARKGQEHLALTRDYFNKIDRYMRESFDDFEETRPMRMKQPAAPVAPVQRTGNSVKPPKEKFILTEDEKFMARNMGVSEEEWMRQKIIDQKLQKERGRPL